MTSATQSRLALASSAVVAGVGAVVFLWRLLSWPSAATTDAWTYAAWGQAVTRLERPLFELGATTPKPLAVLLGTAVAPLPPERAFTIVVALAAGVLGGAVFAAAYRDAGTIAAAVAVVALVVAAPLSFSVVSGYVDVVVAALVAAGVALRGPWRIGALVLAGLLRPEAWVLAGIAGFTEGSGSRRRRLALGAAAGLAAPVLWMLGDLVLAGDPLGTAHWQSESHARNVLADIRWLDVPDELWSALTTFGGVVFVVLGAVGLVVRYAGARRRGGAVDPMPLAAAAVWSVLLALETRYGRELNARYLYPVVAVLAVGWGFLASSILSSRLRARSPWPAAAVAAAAIVIAVVVPDLGTSDPRPGVQRWNDAVAALRPTVESALACGKVGTTEKAAATGLIPKLAASSRRSLHEFGVYPDGGPYAAVLAYRPGWRPGQRVALPSWPLRSTALGPLAVSPGCAPLQGR
jgi:hypothetical protein